MHRLILTKAVYSTDVAHLYEHLFCMAVNSFFLKQHLFQYLDFSLVGKTHHNGVVVVDIEFYTKEAIKLAGEISSLQLDLNYDEIFIAMLQILAEEGEPVAMTSMDEVMADLKTIQSEAWIDYDKSDVLVSKKQEKSDSSFYVAQGESRTPSVLTASVNLRLDTIKEPAHLPLFHQLAQFITENFQVTLGTKFGVYSYEDRFTKDDGIYSYNNYFKVPDTDEVELDLKEVAVFVRQFINRLSDAGAFLRFFDSLKNLSLYSNPNVVPDFERIYRETEVMMGAKGWSRLFEQKIDTQIMKDVEVIVSFDGKTETFKPFKS